MGQVKNGEVPAALAALERAEAAEPVPVVRYHLGMAQLSAGQRERGTDNLRAALSTGRSFPGAEDARATLARATPTTRTPD